MNHRMNSQSGMGMVEMLLSVGILGGLALGVAKLGELGQSSGKTNRQNFEITALTNEVRSFLSDGEVCKKNFGGFILNGSHVDGSAVMADVDKLIDLGDKSRFDKTSKYANQELKISSIRMGGFAPHNSAALGQTLGESKLVVVFEKIGKAYSSKEIRREITLAAKVDDLSTRKLISCSAQALGDGYWTASALGIKYADGLVGVGTDDPRNLLHIVGGAAATAVSGDFPFAENNSLIVVENQNNTPGAQAGISIVTSPSSQGVLQFTDRDATDGTPSIWDGAIHYNHANDELKISTGGGGVSGGSIFVKKAGQLIVGYSSPPTDPVANHFMLDVRSPEIGGGSGIRIKGNEVVTGHGRARLILQDQRQWALNSMGPASPFPAAFSLGQRESGSFPIVVSQESKIALLPPSTGVGWANNRDLEIYGDAELMNSKTLFVSKIDAVTASIDISKAIIVSGDVSATAFTTTSDRRRKTDIHEITNALAKLEKIHGVRFYWKDQSQDRTPQLGVLAQDVQKVFPEAVTQGSDGTLKVNYDALIPPMLEGMKQMQREIKALRAELQELKK